MSGTAPGPRPDAVAIPRLSRQRSACVGDDVGEHPGSRGRRGSGARQLLLDGQQRLTSMYGVIRGNPPPFFEGDASSFSGLHFNVDTETFKLYGRHRYPVLRQTDATEGLSSTTRP